MKIWSRPQVYSFGKYIITGTCGFLGLMKLEHNDAAGRDHWYALAERDRLKDADPAKPRYEDLVHVAAGAELRGDESRRRRGYSLESGDAVWPRRG